MKDRIESIALAWVLLIAALLAAYTFFAEQARAQGTTSKKVAACRVDAKRATPVKGTDAHIVDLYEQVVCCTQGDRADGEAWVKCTITVRTLLNVLKQETTRLKTHPRLSGGGKNLVKGCMGAMNRLSTSIDHSLRRMGFPVQEPVNPTYVDLPINGRACRLMAERLGAVLR